MGSCLWDFVCRVWFLVWFWDCFGFGLFWFGEFHQHVANKNIKLYQIISKKPFKLGHETHETVVPAKTWQIFDIICCRTTPAPLCPFVNFS